MKLGGSTTTTGSKRRWRIKIAPKIKIPKVSSAKKWMVWMRDAYVRMMMGLANSKVMNMSNSVNGDLTGGFGRDPPVKEYDNKILIRMYESLVIAQGQLVHRESKLDSAT